MLASPYRECILYGPEMVMIYNDRVRSHSSAPFRSSTDTPPFPSVYRNCRGQASAVARHARFGGVGRDLGRVVRHHEADASRRDGVFQRALPRDGAARFRRGDLPHFLLCAVQERERRGDGHPQRLDRGVGDGYRGEAVGDYERFGAIDEYGEDDRRYAYPLFSHSLFPLLLTDPSIAIADFSEIALKSLSTNSYDIPFALLYTAEEVAQKPSKKEVRLGFDRSTRTNVKLTCRGSSGIPENHPFLIKEALIDITPAMSRSSSASTSTGTGSTTTALDFRDRGLDSGSLSPGGAHCASPAPSSSASSASTSRFPGLRSASSSSPAWTWPFEEACFKRDPVLVEDLGPFAESLDRSKGWSIPTKNAVVIPVMVEAGQTVPSAVLVLGVNPMNRYGGFSLLLLLLAYMLTMSSPLVDHLMETFFNLVARHLAIGFFSVLVRSSL
jgi:hypothetical protein